MSLKCIFRIKFKEMLACASDHSGFESAQFRLERKLDASGQLGMPAVLAVGSFPPS